MSEYLLLNRNRRSTNKDERSNRKILCVFNMLTDNQRYFVEIAEVVAPVSLERICGPK